MTNHLKLSDLPDNILLNTAEYLTTVHSLAKFSFLSKAIHGALQPKITEAKDVHSLLKAIVDFELGTLKQLIIKSPILFFKKSDITGYCKQIFYNISPYQLICGHCASDIKSQLIDFIESLMTPVMQKMRIQQDLEISTSLYSPQAILITKPIWKYVWAKASQQFFIEHSASIRQGVLELPSINVNGALIDTQKFELCLAYALCHRNISDDKLRVLAQHLDLSDKLLFKVAAITGRLNIIRSIAENFSIITFIICEDSSFIACCSSDTAMFLLEDILANANVGIEYREFISQYKWKILSTAAKYGYINVIDRLHDLTSTINFQQHIAGICDFYPIFNQAAENRQIEFINRLVELIAPNKVQEMLSSRNYWAFRTAAFNGHIEVVNRLIELISQDELQEMLASNNYEEFLYAIYTDKVAIIESLAKLIPPNNLLEIIEHSLTSNKLTDTVIQCLETIRESINESHPKFSCVLI